MRLEDQRLLSGEKVMQEASEKQAEETLWFFLRFLVLLNNIDGQLHRPEIPGQPCYAGYIHIQRSCIHALALHALPPDDMRCRTCS